MKNRILLVAFLGVCSMAYGVDSTQQVWNNLSIKGKLWKNKKKEQSLSVRIEKEIRYSAASDNVYYVHADLLLSYTVLAWLNLGTAYRHAFEIKKGAWLEESRAHLNITFMVPKSITKAKMAGVGISNRSRFEGRFFPEKSSVFRYRNKTSISYTYKFKKLKSGLSLKPNIGTEFFYDHSKKEINRHRFYAYLDFGFYKYYKVAVGYVLQSGFSSGENTRNDHIFGWKAGLSF